METKNGFTADRNKGLLVNKQTKNEDEDRNRILEQWNQ